MRRIGLAVVLALSLSSPILTVAQQEGKVIRIGILGNVPLTDPQGSHLWGGFIQELRALGYIEGRNLKIEHRSSEGRYERLHELAAELVRLKVDVIVVPADQNALAVKQATETIPLVMCGAGDPMSRGLVPSLAHPGGNVTGLSFLAPEIAGKQLELLKEMVPRISRVAIFWNPGNPSSATVLRVGTDAAQSLGMQVQPMPLRGPDEFEKAFATMNRERIAALLVPADGMMLFHRKRIVNLAAKSRLPAIYGLTEYVEAGGLVIYSPSLYDSFRRAAV
jgi:putative ABC transport system substrate-binding protein